MVRRRLLFAAISGLFLSVAAHAQPRPATLAPADQAELGQIQAYLNGITTLHARFLQVAPDGHTSGGEVWLQRPGRMRFQYDPPSPLLLVAGHGIVVFNDKQLGQTSNVPLDSTPLGLLLRPDVTLSGDVTVTDFRRLPGQVQVTLVRTSKPGDGSLTLFFADPPLALRSWSVLDAQGRETRVSLFDVTQGGTFPQSLFTFIDPHFFGNDAMP